MIQLTTLVRGCFNCFRFLCDVMLGYCLLRNLAPTWKLSQVHRRQLIATWTLFRFHTLSNLWQKKKETMPSNIGESPVLRFAKLSANATTPTKGSTQAAGYDLYSAYDCVIPPMGKAIVQTDIQIAIPSGHYGRVAPRSGLAAKHFIDVGAGVIDEDYRGNVGIVLFNFNSTEFKVNKGDRVAQLICERISYPSLEEVDSLDNTERGDGGFGSSGKN